MRNTKAIGDLSEAMVIAALLRAGKVVLRPVGDSQRYDLVVDEGDGFVRVQCKTGRLKNGAIQFRAYSVTGNKRGPNGNRNYRGSADVFGVFCPETNRVYMIPVAAVGTTEIHLRIDAPKIKRTSGINLASDYVLPC